MAKLAPTTGSYVLADLTYDDRPHTYFVRNQIVPGVTSILNVLPRRAAFLALMQSSEKQRAILHAAGELGQAVHAACHYYDDGTLDYKTIPMDGPVYPYLEGWMRFRSESEFDIVGMETMVLHKSMGYAGRYDRKGMRRGSRRRVLLDIKTGDPRIACAGPQTAAYVEAELSQLGVWEPIDRVSVRLPGDGTYKETPHTDRGDFDVFKSAFVIHNYEQRAA